MIDQSPDSTIGDTVVTIRSTFQAPSLSRFDMFFKKLLTRVRPLPSRFTPHDFGGFAAKIVWGEFFGLVERSTWGLPNTRQSSRSPTPGYHPTLLCS